MYAKALLTNNRLMSEELTANIILALVFSSATTALRKASL